MTFTVRVKANSNDQHIDHIYLELEQKIGLATEKTWKTFNFIELPKYEGPNEMTYWLSG
jgi:hypothetical protein